MFLTIRVGRGEVIVTGYSKALNIGGTKPSIIDNKHLWNTLVNIPFQIEEFGNYSIGIG